MSESDKIPQLLGEIDRIRDFNEKLREALLDMVWQFCSNDRVFSHSFMSAEEAAFDVLGIENGMTYEQAREAAGLPKEPY